MSESVPFPSGTPQASIMPGGEQSFFRVDNMWLWLGLVALAIIGYFGWKWWNGSSSNPSSLSMSQQMGGDDDEEGGNGYANEGYGRN